MSNPHFIYKKTFNIIECDLFEINDAFDIYSLYKDKNKIYLCGENKAQREILEIFEFKEHFFEKKLTLKNHKEFITNCKYFINKKLIKEYLVSTDNGETSNTIIWLIKDENNYQEILNIKNNDRLRFPFSLVFNYNNKNNNQLFFIHPSSQVDSEVISEDNKIFKKIFFTEGQIFQYIIWENNNNNKNYIIQSNIDNVYIYDIFNKKSNYVRIISEEIYGKNFSIDIIYNKNNTDILCIVNEMGNIVFYDLFTNKISFVIKTYYKGLVNICQFNKNYLIFLNKNGFFIIFDYHQRKIINKNNSANLSKVKNIKIINQENLGKYILIGGFMTGLLLYKNVDKIKISK